MRASRRSTAVREVARRLGGGGDLLAARRGVGTRTPRAPAARGGLDVGADVADHGAVARVDAEPRGRAQRSGPARGLRHSQPSSGPCGQHSSGAERPEQRLHARVDRGDVGSGEQPARDARSGWTRPPCGTPRGAQRARAPRGRPGIGSTRAGIAVVGDVGDRACRRGRRGRRAAGGAAAGRRRAVGGGPRSHQPVAANGSARSSTASSRPRAACADRARCAPTRARRCRAAQHARARGGEPRARRAARRSHRARGERRDGGTETAATAPGDAAPARARRRARASRGRAARASARRRRCRPACATEIAGGRRADRMQRPCARPAHDPPARARSRAGRGRRPRGRRAGSARRSRRRAASAARR